MSACDDVKHDDAETDDTVFLSNLINTSKLGIRVPLSRQCRLCSVRCSLRIVEHFAMSVCF